jgi:Recombination endonuclease VII
MTAKEKAKDLRLRREYNITLAEYNQVLQYQKGCCAICKKKYGKKGQKLILSVDHCHTTGLVRGLLCWPCNRGIAVFQDDYKRLGAASSYLIAPSFSCVLSVDRFCVPGKVGTKIRAKKINALRGKSGTDKKRKTGKKLTSV